MATYFARKAGNINASDVWATTPSGTAAAVTFASGDVLMANSFAISVNVTTNLGSTGQVRNDTTGGATAGGSFTLANGVTLTANIFAGATSCVNLTGGSFLIYGNVTGGTGTGSGAVISSSGSNTLNVYGNITGGSGNNSVGIYCLSSTLFLVIEGNIVGGSSNLGSGVHYNNTGNGTINVTGNVTGGTANTACGISTTLTANTVNVTGIVTGGTLAANFGCQVAGVLTVNGIAVGGIAGAGVSTGTGVFATRVVGNGFGPGSVGLTGAPGISNSGTSIVEVSELEYGLRGMSPTVGIVRLKNTGSNTVTFNLVDSGSAKTLIDATANAAMPAASDVRSGVSYASGALTGSAFIPSPSSVASGVPVDATTGTAVLTIANVATAVWGAATRTLTAGAGISASDVWSHASRTLTTSSGPTAVEIRQEMDANSTKLDASVSSRLASASYTAPTTPPTAAEIATAVEGSLLNEADGQAVLNAIVGAIGNTNLSEVSLVAAIRSDIERTGGKLDSVPTAAANASAVWGTATKTITGGTVDTLTNSPSVPSAASIASATRTELAVELARVDSAVSSRMAGSESTKLDAVKVKTDALNTERLANVATTAIVGNLIAQANS